MGKTKATIHCSACGEAGHTKRNCAELIRSEKARRSIIPVHLTSEMRLSPHVIELGKTHSKDHWRHIEVYNETILPKVERQTVDIAAMVRSANELHQDNDHEDEEEDFVLPQRRSLFARGARFIQPRFVIVALVVAILLTAPFPAMSYYMGLKADTEKIIQESTNAFLSL